MGSSREEALRYVEIIKHFLQDYFHATKSEVPKSARQSLNQRRNLQDNLNLWDIKIPVNVSR